MSGLSTDAVRTTFLGYFRGHGHLIVPSHSLVPPKTSPLLFTSAGVDQFLPYMLGHSTPPNRRIASVQKVFRTTDLDEVGDFTHHTFFEMLGNWSIGDYFKSDAIAMAWDLSTGAFGIDPQRIAVTVHPDDTVSPEAWKRVGVPPVRIFTLKGNWWPEQEAKGPCGPDSEMFYDWGAELGCGRSDCGPACSCGRYVEFWNLVFMQYDRDEQGVLTPLPTANVDTGMGVERMACIQQDVRVTYDTDVLRHLLHAIATVAHAEYGADERISRSQRIIADHCRAATFLLADGVRPDNTGRGYVLRRIIRRAVRHGVLLDVDDLFMSSLAQEVVQQYRGAYPELGQLEGRTAQILNDEESRFRATLSAGIGAFERVVAGVTRQGSATIPGDQAFMLYDAHGLPLEVVEELAAERSLRVDVRGFDESMAKQVAAGKEAHRRSHTGAVGAAANEVLATLPPTTFVGYDQLECSTGVVAIIVNGAAASGAEAGTTCDLVLKETPFYTESGGQVSDTGWIRIHGTDVPINALLKLPNGAVLHRLTLPELGLIEGSAVMARVNASRRAAIRRNHTATHLLHTSLRRLLGQHVEQRGSVVAPDHLTFDFSHASRVDTELLQVIEEEINQRIQDNLPVTTRIMPLAEAKATGAMALFDEKYGDQVRVVSIDGWSTELCGGTHVRHTGDIGSLLIVSETGIGSGLRRIEARTGQAAIQYHRQEAASLDALAKQLQTPVDTLGTRVEALLAEGADLKKTVTLLETELLRTQVEQIVAGAWHSDGVTAVASTIRASSVDALRTAGDLLLDKVGTGYVVLAAPQGDRALLLTAVSPELKENGVDANTLMKRLVKRLGAGGGGGNSRMATGSSPNLTALEPALRDARDELLAGVQRS